MYAKDERELEEILRRLAEMRQSARSNTIYLAPVFNTPSTPGGHGSRPTPPNVLDNYISTPAPEYDIGLSGLVDEDSMVDIDHVFDDYDSDRLPEYDFDLGALIEDYGLELSHELSHDAGYMSDTDDVFDDYSNVEYGGEYTGFDMDSMGSMYGGEGGDDGDGDSGDGGGGDE